jgi:hypothetical protein
MDLKEKEWEGVEWIHPVQDRGQSWALVETIMNLWVP